MHNQHTYSLKQQQSLTLPYSITCLSSSVDYFAVGTLDDTTRIWRNKFPLTREPILVHSQQISSLVDISFMKSSNYMATLSIDSTIKIWDLDTRSVQTIEVPMLQAWKMCFVADTIMVCGELGRVLAYDLFSKQVVKKMDVGDYFLTSIAKHEQNNKIAVANINGDAFICSTQGREQPYHLRPHHKPILSLLFNNSYTHLLCSSEDTTVSCNDLIKQKKQRVFEGHQQKVTCIRKHYSNPSIFYSCSTDRSVRVWDQRVQGEVGKYIGVGVGAGLEVGEKVAMVGGDAGVLQVLALG